MFKYQSKARSVKAQIDISNATHTIHLLLILSLFLLQILLICLFWLLIVCSFWRFISSLQF